MAVILKKELLPIGYSSFLRDKMKDLFLETWKSHTEVYKWVHLKGAKGGL